MGSYLQALTHSGRWQALLVLFASGALFSLAFAPFYYWPVLFVSLPIFYLLTHKLESDGQGMVRGFAFGYGFFMAGTWWISNALMVDAEKFGWLRPFSVVGLSAAMAFWFMLFGLLLYYFRRWMNPVLFALLWVVVEWLRSYGMFGFPWNLAGYSSFAILELAQLASLVGIYGVSFFVVLLALFPCYWLIASLTRQRWIITGGTLLLVAMAYLFGLQMLAKPTEFTNLRLRLVQPNIPQAIKGKAEGEIIAARILGKLTVPSDRENAADVTIWPETAYPFRVEQDYPLMVPDFEGLLITGAVRSEKTNDEQKIWNSIVTIDTFGKVLASYDKHQLVPFGEFVPLRKLLPLDKITPGAIDFSRGVGVQTIAISSIPPFSPLVCYEGIFSSLAVDGNNRPQWMLNLTNDAWYGLTPGPHQHFAMVRMRAIEQGLPMVRVANNGISAVIDGRGRVVNVLPLNARGVIDARLPAAEAETWYSKLTQPAVQTQSD